MNKDTLEMPSNRKKSSGGKALAALVILVLAGVGAWMFFSGEKTGDLVDSARRQIESVVGGESPADGTHGQPGETLPIQNVGPDGTAVGAGAAGAGGVPDDNGNVVQPPAGVAVPDLQTEPVEGGEPGSSSSEASGTVRDNVDKALADSSSSSLNLTQEQRNALPTAGNAVSGQGAPSDAGRSEDSVVTSEFIKNMARWLVHSYQAPSGQNLLAGKTGRTSASLMGANMRFGGALSGLNFAGGDPISGREAVLNYVYTPGMIDALYRLYVDRFITAMQGAAQEGKDGGPGLSNAQAADMFSVYAGLFRQLSASLRGVADLPDLRMLVAGLHSAGQAVVHANGVFAEVLFAFEEARDQGETDEAEMLSRNLQASSVATEKAIQARAQARGAVADAIKIRAGGKTLGEDSLVYLAEWVNRRGEPAQTSPATTMASEIMLKLADQCDAQAILLASGAPQ